MIRRKPRCPRCAAVLTIKRRWFGLVRTIESPCPGCGAKLGFDTAGGVHLVERSQK